MQPPTPLTDREAELRDRILAFKDALRSCKSGALLIGGREADPDDELRRLLRDIRAALAKGEITSRWEEVHDRHGRLLVTAAGRPRRRTVVRAIHTWPGRFVPLVVITHNLQDNVRAFKGSYRCALCGDTFANKSNLNDHERRIHRPEETESEPEPEPRPEPRPQSESESESDSEPSSESDCEAPSPRLRVASGQI